MSEREGLSRYVESRIGMKLDGALDENKPGGNGNRFCGGGGEAVTQTRSVTIDELTSLADG